MQEVTLLAVGLNDAPLVRRVGQVASRTARHQYLHARTAILLDQQRALAARRRFRRSQQPCRPRADNDNVMGIQRSKSNGQGSVGCLTLDFRPWTLERLEPQR